MGEGNTVVNNKPLIQEQCTANSNGKNALLVRAVLAVEDSSSHTRDTR